MSKTAYCPSAKVLEIIYLDTTQGQHDPSLGSGSAKADPEMNVHVQSRSQEVLPGENSKGKEDWKNRKPGSCVTSAKDVAPA